jgi:hypothetical protein
MKSGRRALVILAIGAGLSLCWMAALRFLPRPALAETNYEANRLRIEGWLLDPPAPSVLVGTSIAGRLLTGYFADTPLADAANLGLDGASPATGLRLALMRGTPPGILFLDVHLLDMPPEANDRQLLGLATGAGLRVGRLLPLSRARARPSTVLYGWLKERQGTRAGDGVGGEAAPPPSPRSVKADAEGKEAQYSEVVKLLRELRDKGTRIVLIRLPAGWMNLHERETLDRAERISRELGSPLVDLLKLSRESGLGIAYTDGLHLTPRSARAVARLLAGAVPPR